MFCLVLVFGSAFQLNQLRIAALFQIDSIDSRSRSKQKRGFITFAMLVNTLEVLLGSMNANKRLPL